MTRPVKMSPTFPNLHFHTCSTPASVASCRLERNVGFHLAMLDFTSFVRVASRATCWLGTRCTRAALGARRSPDGSARTPARPVGSARTPARPVGSARAVPVPPSARGAHQMVRYALPRDLLAERTEVPFGRYGKGRRRAVFRTCRLCFRIIILAFKDFAFHRSEAKSHVQPRENPLNCRL